MTRTDLLIIGGGVIGLSTARAAVARGASVTLIDAHEPGGRGSRAAAGVIVPSARLIDDPELLAFVKEAARVLEEELSSLPEPHTLRRGHGILRIVPDARMRAALEARAKQEPEWLGAWVSAQKVAEEEPALVGSTLEGAFKSDAGYMVDTEAYLNALLHDLSGRGVELRLGEQVLDVQSGAGGVRVRTDRGLHTADRVAVCAGAWSGTIPGVPDVPVRPMRGQMITVLHPTLRLQRVVSAATYLAPWRRGEIVVGATEEDAGFKDHVTPIGLLHLTATLAKLAPGLREARYLGSWAGLRSVAPGGRPVIGPHPKVDRVWLASGHAGQGIISGALTGRTLLERMDTGKCPLIEPFDPARAAERKDR